MAQIEPDSIKVYAYLSGSWVELDTINPIKSSSGILDNSPTARLADIGTLEFDLNNEDEIYLPGLGTALAGWDKGTTVKIEFVYVETVVKFLGYVDEIRPDIRKKRVSVTAYDWLDIASKYPIINPSLLEDVTAKDAIDTIIASMPIAPSATDIPEGDFEFPTVFDTVSGYTKAYTEFAKLANSELGYIYRRADTTYGDTLVFEPFSSRNGTREIDQYTVIETGFLKLVTGDYLLKQDGGKFKISQTTFEDAVFDNSHIDSDISYGENVINKFVANAYPKRTDTEPVLIHESEQEIRLSAGETKKFRVFWTDPTGKRKINAFPPVGSSKTKSILNFEQYVNGNSAQGFSDLTGRVWDITDVDQYTGWTAGVPVKFGSACGYFDGTGSYISTADTDDLDMGTDDFCIEWWEWRFNTTSNCTAFSRDGTTGFQAFQLARSNGTNNLVYMSSNGSSWDIANGKTMGSISANQWVHLAVSREGSTFRTFKNGTLQDTWTSSAALYASSSDLFFGKYGSTYITALADDIRITKGEAVYTASFSVPTTTFAIAGAIYTMRSAAGGLGANLDSYVSVESANYGTEGATIEVKNTSSSTGYLSVKIYGYGIYSDSTLEASIENEDSITDYGYQIETLQQPYQQDIYAGTLEANRVVELNASSRISLNKFRMCANTSAENMSAFLNIDVGDLVQIIIYESNIDSLFYVQGVEFEVRGKIIFFTWTVKQAWTLSDGLSLMAAEFGSGVTDALSFGYLPKVSNATYRGFSLWLYIDDYGFVLSNTDGFNNGFAITISSSSKPLLWMSTTDVSGYWVANNPVSTGTWIHLFIEYDRSSTANDPIIYVNGSSVAITEGSTPTGDYGDEIGLNLFIGNRIQKDAAFDGKLKDVRIYDLDNSDHTGAELAAGLYAEGAGGDGFYSGMMFIGPVVREEDVTAYTDLTLTTEKVLDGYVGAIGTPSGSPIIRSI